MATIDLTVPEVKTFKLPPAGFDPMTASAQELARHGFPPRLEDPRQRARYDRVMSSLAGKLEVIKPELKYNADKLHGLRRTAEDAGSETSGNWSGGVVFCSPGDSFQWVQGDWIVPGVSAPGLNQWYYCASWVGIDGDGSGDVCQAGVECEVLELEIPFLGRRSFVNIYPWVEWFPTGELQITNLAVRAGDQVTVLICAGAAGSSNATVFFSNRTTGVSTSLALTAPSGTQLTGNCAEWIVEAPTVGGQQSSMADYGQVCFTNADSATHNGTTVDGGTGDNIDMLDSSNNVVSEGILIGPTTVQCLYV